MHALGALGPMRAQGLFTHRRHAGRAAAKWRQLHANTECSDLVVIAEAHGLRQGAETFRREIPHFISWLSAGEHTGIGGVFFSGPSGSGARAASAA